MQHWKGIQKSKNLECDRGSLTGSYGKFFAEPLEPGFGVTVGHSLRRVLLSSLRGLAVTGVIIAGVADEFTPIPGVVEDTLSVLLNFKSLRFKVFDAEKWESPAPFRLTVKNTTHDEKVITAADIRIDSSVKILNPEIQLATLQPRTELQLEVYVELGRGYIPAEMFRARDGQQDGMLYVDAVFSPVTAVEFSVEPTRVGRRTDFDKLTVEIWTNGSISPIEALGHGTKILSRHLVGLINFEEEPEEEIVEIEEEIKLMNICSEALMNWSYPYAQIIA